MSKPSRRFAWSLVAALLVSAAAVAMLRYALPDRISIDIEGQPFLLREAKNLAWIGVLPLLLFGAFVSLARQNLLARICTLLLRTLVIAAVAIALSLPAWTHDKSEPAVAIVVDASASISDEALAEAQKHIDSVWAQAEGKDVSVIIVAERAALIASENDAAPQIKRPAENTTGHTDLEAGVELALASLPADRVPSILLLTDGHATRGHVLEALARAQQSGVETSVVGPTAKLPGEISIKRLELPRELKVNAFFKARVILHSTSGGRAKVELFQEDAPNALGPSQEIDLVRGENEVAFDSVVRVAGPTTYRAKVTPLSPDRFSENNQLRAIVEAIGQPLVLAIDPEPDRLSSLARALETTGFDVDVRTPAALPSRASDLSRNAMVILSDTAASQVTSTQVEAIEQYMRQYGGGFLMAGGAKGYSLGQWQGTRMEELLPVRLEGKRRRDEPVAALVLLIDKSGSMSGQKLELAKEAARATADLLSDDDYLGVIGFDSEPRRIVRLQSLRNRFAVTRDIGKLTAGGGTAIFPGLDAAYQDLSVQRAKVKHIILLSDGISDDRGLMDLAQMMRLEGITLTTIGLGGDVNRRLLETLATRGGGRSYFTADPSNLPRIFVKEAQTVTRPNAVEEYVRAERSSEAAFLRGIDLASSPLLRGYVSTTMKAAPAEQILRSDLAEPLLARWHVGLGWSLAWTSDLKSRWATDWLRWGSFPSFISQLVREHMKERPSERFKIQAEPDGEAIRIRFDALDANEGFITDLDTEVTLTSEGSTTPLTATLEQTSPGLYEATIKPERYGAFRVLATHKQNGYAVGHSRATTTLPYPLEFQETGNDDQALQEMARAGGGTTSLKIDRLLSTRGEKRTTYEPLHTKLLIAALLLLLLELACRRLLGSELVRGRWTRRLQPRTLPG